MAFLASFFFALCCCIYSHVPFLDRGLFGRINKTTGTPLYSVWIVVLVSFLPGLLDLASPIAANAIFSLTAMGTCLHYTELPIF